MWYDPDSRKQMHSKGDCAVLIKLDKNSERRQEKGKGWAYSLMGTYNDFMMRTRVGLKMIKAVMNSMRFASGEDFYWMASKFYKSNPISYASV